MKRLRPDLGAFKKSFTGPFLVSGLEGCRRSNGSRAVEAEIRNFPGETLMEGIFEFVQREVCSWGMWFLALRGVGSDKFIRI